MAIDYLKFGSYIREQRNEMGYSQAEVYKKTGVSAETQRLLENGKREPRIITLERLSELYKVDLIFQLRHFRKVSDLFSYTFLEKTAETFNARNYDDFTELIKELADAVRQEYYADGHKTKENMDFLSTIEHIRNVQLDGHRFEMSSAVFYEKFLISLSKDKKEMLSDSNLYYLEIQAGILLAIIYKNQGAYEDYKKLLLLLIASLERNAYMTERQMDYYVICYMNLCKYYHLIDEHQKVIDTAQYILTRKDLRLKRHYANELLFRQAIAEFSLGNDDYKHLLGTVFMTSSEEKATEYRNSLMEHYGIDMADFMSID